MILSIADTLDSYEIVAVSDTVPTTVSGFYSFLQYGFMSSRDSEGKEWTVATGEPSWNLQNPFGVDASAAFYLLDTELGTLTLQDSKLLPQYPQGVGYCEKKGYLFTSLNQVGTGPSVRQDPIAPYSNAAADKESEIQIFEIKENQGTLEYLGGIDIDTSGVQIRPSDDCKLMATTVASSSLFNYLLDDFTDPFSPVTRWFAPTSVQLYEIKGKKVEATGAITSASPLPFALQFYDDDTKLFVGGQSTYQLKGGLTTGQKGEAIYSVLKNGKEQ